MTTTTTTTTTMMMMEPVWRLTWCLTPPEFDSAIDKKAIGVIFN